MTDITLLYFDDCPSWKPALKNLKQVIEDEQIQAEIILLNIDDPVKAQKEHFLGSPSIRIDGIDLWPEERTNFNLSCRVYKTPEGVKGSPTVDMLKERIRTLFPH